MGNQVFRDAADHRRASYNPDFVEKLDRLDDFLKEAIAAWRGEIPKSLREFHEVVFSILTAAVKCALGDGATIEKTIQRYADEQTDERVWAAISAVIAEVRSQSDAEFSLDCLAHAAGLMTIQGETMTATGRRHPNLQRGKPRTRASVSKRAVFWCKKLGLPPSRGMKSEEACEVYSQLKLAYAAAGL